MTLTGPKLILDNYELKYYDQVKNIGLANTKNLNWTNETTVVCNRVFADFHGL